MNHLKQTLLAGMDAARDQFRRSSSNLTDEISQFQPAPEMMNVAQQMAHVSQVIDWLVDGVSGADGFDLDFEPQIARVMAVSSLSVAREWFEGAMARAIGWLDGADESEMLRLLPDGPVFPGRPAYAVVIAIIEHTSHHRGSLAVYARLAGLHPTDPYGL